MPYFDALTLKSDKEDYATLSFGSTVTWATANKQNALAKLTATGSFTIDMTSVKSGSNGLFKLITNTASAIVMTFDADLQINLSILLLLLTHSPR
jgi:hypothetical protein